jgi:hypothetical protein
MQMRRPTNLNPKARVTAANARATKPNQEQIMNAYRTESSFFRPAFGVAAVALTVLTVSFAIVVPAYLSPGQAPMELAAKTAAAHVTEVAISPPVIEVVVLREHKPGPETLLPAQHPTRAARALPTETRLAPTSGSTMIEWQCPSTARGRNA